MKSILIVAVLLSTIMASESSAQDTLAKTKTGVPVITAPRVGTQEVKKLNTEPRPDTASVKVFRGSKDSATVHALAVKQSPQPDSAHVTQLVVWSDTAVVWMQTGVFSQRLRFERRKGNWTLVPEARGGWKSDSAAAAAPPPPRPKPDTTIGDVCPPPYVRVSTLTRDDSLAIKNAAGQNDGEIRTLLVAGDTAWVYGTTTRPIKTDTTGKFDVTVISVDMAVEPWGARVEKRNGAWVQGTAPRRGAPDR